MKLGIEVDGPSHVGRKGYDEARTKYLFDKGWTILRFTDKQVIETPGRVGETVLLAANGLAGYLPPTRIKHLPPTKKRRKK
jgi:very-short-patch-repair endonuclease